MFFNNLLNLQILSPLDTEPVLINGMFNATAASTINVSNVSPLLCDIIQV